MSHLNLKNFAADAKSGFLIFLIALPLCLGISIASGFPAVAGILTAIVGGCVASFFGGSRLTIKGPAAGLIVIAIGAVMELGQGNMELGYHRALAVGVAAALVQMLFSFFRVANLGISISKSVVHGMMAAIGVIIITKQIHVMLGAKVVASSIFGSMAQIPHSFMNANPIIAAIGIGSFLLLILWPKIKFKALKAVPPQIVILIIAIALSYSLKLNEVHSYAFFSETYEVGIKYLVQLPLSLTTSLAFPDFSVIFSSTSIKYIVMFALVGMIESTLTVVAIDNIDPEKRTSNLNRDLFALSCGNLISSLIGGLPMISEIVRSKANVDNGAKSAFANFSHGVFLLIFVAFFPLLLDMIPLSALAAMLVYVGTRLASINEVKHIKTIGIDQLILFSITLFMTLATDLLIGVACGLVMKIVLHLSRGVTLKSLFMSEIETVIKNDYAAIVFHGAAAFPALFRLRKILNNMPENVKKITINLNKAELIDHTFLSGMTNIINEKSGVEFDFVGLEKFTKISKHPQSTGWA